MNVRQDRLFVGKNLRQGLAPRCFGSPVGLRDGTVSSFVWQRALGAETRPDFHYLIIDLPLQEPVHVCSHQ